jgi:hypothetical protein
MGYCESDGNGTCLRCGIAYPDGRYSRECQPLSYWIEQSRTQEQHVVEVAAGVDQAPPDHGPGTELSKLLKRFGIEPTPTCACRAKATQMDAWGCDEASKPERIDEVVAVMRAEAEARGLPFLDMAGRMLVRRAIANARRNA